MKKNKMMRLASCLLVMVLLTTSMISGTFAKYVTSDAASDSARVAKWGVTVTADGEGTFVNKYARDDDSSVAGEYTVVATEDVLAPGTAGDFAKFSITGEPEVTVLVEFSVNKFELGDNWVDANGNYYCPIEITVGTNTYKGLDYKSVDLFEDAVKVAITDSRAYEVGFNLINAYAPSISWAWAFEGNDDVKDTFLGDKANAKIELDVKCTITQID